MPNEICKLIAQNPRQKSITKPIIRLITIACYRRQNIGGATMCKISTHCGSKYKTHRTKKKTYLTQIVYKQNKVQYCHNVKIKYPPTTKHSNKTKAEHPLQPQ